MHIDRNGIVCGHLNADGNSFCVKCGNPFDGKKRKVVREEEYDELKEKAKNTEVLFDGTYQKLQTIYKEGYAPKGYHIEKDKSIWEKYSHKTLSIIEYNRLLERANQSWWKKLREAVKKWWDDTGEIICLFLAFVIFVCGAIWLTVGNVASGCSNNSAVIKIEQRDGLWGLVKGGDIVIPFEYDSIVADKYETEFSRVYKGEHVGLINNTTGKEMVPCIYLEVGELNNVSLRGKLIAVKKDDGKWQFVDYSGLPTGRLNLYDYAKWWSNADMGFVGMKINGEMKYGYADSSGFVKIPCDYVEVHSLFEGLALVKKAKYASWICINDRGEEQYRLNYTICDIYQDSLMAVSNDNAWNTSTLFGFVDRNGKLVIDKYFTPWVLDNNQFYMPRFNDGKAEVRYRGENGWIDKSGKFTPAKK